MPFTKELPAMMFAREKSTCDLDYVCVCVCARAHARVYVCMYVYMYVWYYSRGYTM